MAVITEREMGEEVKHLSFIDCCYRIRAQFGTSVVLNAVHGPSSSSAAENEIKLIFGDVEFDEQGLRQTYIFCVKIIFNLFVFISVTYR